MVSKFGCLRKYLLGLLSGEDSRLGLELEVYTKEGR
jgi:hypothetical protein